ncbi:hypothetical protein [Hymenobacter metallicola]|uniref:DUF3298 domain-containing protein n=1 Tax=Hymenobacter metallicola TaxID=2563114 RepID=A0A4Z0QHP8_9BACT|nr:hypothetical protein [Hymenobacter metallicola]TGE28773.1 hypothetical protein E5K02_04730 [Hymenobacter metallicola]
MRRLLVLLLAGLGLGSGPVAAQTLNPAADSVVRPVPGSASFVGPPDTSARPTRLYHERLAGPRRLRGAIGKFPITMELDSANGSYTGGYYYERWGVWQEARFDAGPGPRTVNVCETPAGDITGQLRLPGKKGGTVRGTWENADGRRTAPFTLRETYAKAARYEQDLWEMWRYNAWRETSQQPRDSAFFYQFYLEVKLPQNPGAERRLRQVLAAPVSAEMMPLYLDTLLRRKQRQDKGYQFHGSTDVVYNGNNLFSVMRVSSFQQGPDYQPHEWYDGVSFDLRTGRRLKLADLLVKDYQKRLLSLFQRSVERYLAGLPASRAVKAPLPRLPVGGFVLAPAGLVFTLDDRDDARLSKAGAGTADRFLEIVLTYEELLPLIKRSGPLGPVLQERGLVPKK